MTEEKLKEVKSVLRGLLISCPRQMTLEGLRRDFRSQEGCDVPYRDFGFPTLQAFLKSIPDTIEVNGNIIVPVVSKKTAHVDALVTKQKITKPQGRYIVPARRRKNIPSSYFGNKLQSLHPFDKSGVKATCNDISPPKDLFIPYDVQNTLHQLLAQHPEGVSLQDIEAEVCSKFPLDKYEIHGGAQQLVDSLPFVAVMSNGLVFSAIKEKHSTDHNYNTASNSNYSKEKNEESLSALKNHETNRTEKKLSSNEVTLIPAGYESHVVNWRASEKKKGNTRYVRGQEYEYASPIGSTNGISSVDIDHVEERILCSSLQKKNNPLINDKVISNFQQIMDECPDGVWCTEMPDKYREKFGVFLNFRSYGLTSMVQMASELPEVFHILRPDGNDSMLLDARKPIPCDFANHNLFDPDYEKHHNYPDNVNVPQFIQKNIMRLLRENRHGLRKDLFLSKYEDKYLTSLSILKMGFSSLDSFLQYLMEVNTLQLSEDLTLILPVEVDDDSFANLEDSPAKSFPKTIKAPDLSLYPFDVLGPYDDIPQETIPSYVGDTKYLEVCVGEVKDPSFFWVQLGGEDHRKSLDKLMDDLQPFYLLHMHEYKIPKGAVRVNQICASLYESDWHRARITRITGPEEVELFYIDYGTKSKVKVTELCFLIKKFGYLPAQAIRCCLANVKPANGATKWPIAASKRFLQMVSDKALYGLVHSIDQQTQSFTASLVDTSNADDFHIDKGLVQEGHAEFSPSLNWPVEEKPMAGKGSSSSSGTSESPPLLKSPSMQCQQTMYANLGSRNGPILELPLHRTSSADLLPCSGLDSESSTKADSTSVNACNIKNLELPVSSSLGSISSTEIAKESTACDLAPSCVTRSTNVPFQQSEIHEPHRVLRPPPGFNVTAKSCEENMEEVIAAAVRNQTYSGTENLTAFNPFPFQVPFLNNFALNPPLLNYLPPYFFQQCQTTSPLLTYNSMPLPNFSQSPLVNSTPNTNLVLPPDLNGPPLGYLLNSTVRTDIQNNVSAELSRLPYQRNISQPFVQTVKGNIPSNLILDSSVMARGNSSSSVSNYQKHSFTVSGDTSSRTAELVDRLNLSESKAVENSHNNLPVEEGNVFFGLKPSNPDSDSTEQKMITSESEVNGADITSGSDPVREDDFVSATSEPPDSVSSSQNCIEEYENIIYRSDSERDNNSRQNSEEEEDLSLDVVIEEVDDIIPQEPHCVKEITIAGKKLLLLNVNGEPFLCTDQFVPLFTPFTTRFAVLKILETYKINVPFSEAERENHPELFKSLEAIQTDFLKKSPDGKIQKRVHMIPFRSSVEVLKLLQQSSEILNGFKVEIENFDPQDVYWRGNGLYSEV